jgi:hypothetical protein
MEMSFFVVCPLCNCECKAPKIGMNCNQGLTILCPFDSSQFSGHISRIYKACPPRPETGTGSGGATLRITFLVLNEYGIFSIILSPYKPGLGQGHTKKRHLRTPMKVYFLNNLEAKCLGYALLCIPTKLCQRHVLHSHTTINHDDGTCHVRTFESQKTDHLCDLMGLPRTAHRNPINLSF